MDIFLNVMLFADDTEDDEKELEHSSLQEKLDQELKELDKKLEQKEVNIRFARNSFRSWPLFLSFLNFDFVIPSSNYANSQDMIFSNSVTKFGLNVFMV